LTPLYPRADSGRSFMSVCRLLSAASCLKRALQLLTKISI